MSTETASPPAVRWVGRRLRRIEDGYLLTGRGRFVDDVDLPGTLHMALVRSDFANATIASVDTTEAMAVPGVVAVLTANDLRGVNPIRGVLERPEFVATDMSVLAGERVRHVGESIAAVLAESRYAAEDGSEAVTVDYRDLPAVASIAAALAPGAPLVHEHVAGNVAVEVLFGPNPDMTAIFAAAAHVVAVAVSTGRLSASPIEPRACVAVWDDRDDQLVLHTSTQVPHTVRTGVALSLGLDEQRVRVLSPDVGGGFGQKCVVAREEVLVAAAARLLGRPVKWVEDRRENLVAGFHAREQFYELRAAFDESGSLLGLEADICCDLGAYSCYPVTFGVEVLMAANELPGPYRVPAYRARSRGVTTNKAPIAPFRGVSRPQAVLAMERLMDKAADEIGIGRVEIRECNLVRSEEFPYRNIMGASYDQGTYRESLLKCAEVLGYADWPEAQAKAREAGRLLGLGFACFVEPTAYGTAAFGARKMSIVPGYERANVRMDPSGALVVMVATHSHGQGHATAYAQIAADELGIDPSRVHVRQGDTELVPHGWGTFASRSIVAGGGAVSRACGSLADQLRRIAAHLLEANVDDVVIDAGRIGVRGTPASSIAIEEVARIAHHAAHRLPPELGRGLEANESFDPEGTYSNATHGALVEVSPETGLVSIVRYAVVEDCGVMINPMIVDGQVSGGVVQGIGSALLEELVFDDEGQPLATSFIDYLLPTATDVPILELHHLESPTERTPTGAKGMGEGGAIGAPAAILNAVNDALSPFSVEVNRTPIRPEDIIAALARAPAGSPAASAAAEPARRSR